MVTLFLLFCLLSPVVCIYMSVKVIKSLNNFGNRLVSLYSQHTCDAFNDKENI